MAPGYHFSARRHTTVDDVYVGDNPPVAVGSGLAAQFDSHPAEDRFEHGFCSGCRCGAGAAFPTIGYRRQLDGGQPHRAPVVVAHEAATVNPAGDCARAKNIEATV